MEQNKGSAYRQFRETAYRKRYEPALLFGGYSWSYGRLIERIEQAYNTFRQMGVEQGERVCLWLPSCPDLLCAFYGLSRLGAVPVLAHGQCSPSEIARLTRETEASRLMTTADRYERYCRLHRPLGASKISLCRPERDMKGKALAAYRLRQRLQAGEEQALIGNFGRWT